MPMQPRPRAETSRLLFPNLRCCITAPCKTVSRSARARAERRTGVVLLRFERGHVDRETILHIRPHQALVSFVDLLNGDNFDFAGDVVLAAEVEHLLGFGDATD